uniref:Replication protein A C-terminal domain-containing protein n=1 Tax=Entomoneis paludosa TaxID=265537 RepID=A0A7S2YFC8_9STRA|mmetsp:Transcript_30741/g.64187  ORF Transcript_30741/g.64187 Transcript_30741/m.64187 type:complete len:281 (+) Transcript_30741:62-904(+)
MDYGLDYEGDMGGMGGGGHAARSPTASMGNNNTQTGSGSRKRTSYDEQTMHAVTIKQMMGSQPQQISDSNGLQLPDGRNLYHVQFVAAVRSFEDNSTHVMYTMEDGTGGVMEVKQWLDDNAECTAISELRQACSKEHIYLKVVGQLKDYDGKKMVVADSIRPLSTGNEITHHFLQVVYEGEKHKQGTSGSTGSFRQPGFAGTPVLSRGAPLANNGGGESAIRQEIIMELANGGENGNTIDTVINVLRGKYEEESIRQEISYLSGEGKIYSTIDDQHYAVA